MSRVASVLRRAGGRARDAGVTFLAAGLAYYWFVSLVPLGIVTFTLAQALYGDALVARSLDVVGAGLSPAGERALASAVGDTDGTAGVTATGVVALAWSAVRVARGVEHAFDRVYDDAATDGLREGAGVLVAVVPAVLGALAVAGASVLAGTPDPAVAAAQLGGLVVALLPVYVVVPNDVKLRGPGRLASATVSGAVVAAAAWWALAHALRRYVAYGGYSVAYGVLGGALLAVTFLYLGALSLLAGAALNAALAGGGPEQTLPSR